jgi:NhaP-type Na+/H+ and K+/H+ antiporter
MSLLLYIYTWQWGRWQGLRGAIYMLIVLLLCFISHHKSTTYLIAVFISLVSMLANMGRFLPISRALKKAGDRAQGAQA